MDVSLMQIEEESWEVAYETVQRAVSLPQNLPHIVRACWNDMLSPLEFIRLISCPGLSVRCLLRAANIEVTGDQISAVDLQNAVETLGVKTSAIMLAINSICECALNSGPSNRVWAPLFKEMMSEIEMGYHFGTNVKRVGHERGMLVGFSRLGGFAVLMTRFPKAFADWYISTKGTGDSAHALRAFRCEPYQVSSVLMQHLGLGSQVAVATASMVGGINHEVFEVSPEMSSWTATYKWLHALKRGELAPQCEHARNAFEELRIERVDGETPEHLNLLFRQIAELRNDSSSWTWHLPLPTYEETAQAIVYRSKSNAHGATWTKALVLTAR